MKKSMETVRDVKLRNVKLADYEALVAMQHKCFPSMKPWKREQIESQIQIFPEGQLCLEVDGKVAASTSNLIVDFDQYTEWHNWNEISDGGFIRNHDPNGDTLYGIEVMVDPDYRGLTTPAQNI